MSGSYMGDNAKPIRVYWSKVNQMYELEENSETSTSSKSNILMTIFRLSLLTLQISAVDVKDQQINFKRKGR